MRTGIRILVVASVVLAATVRLDRPCDASDRGVDGLSPAISDVKALRPAPGSAPLLRNAEVTYFSDGSGKWQYELALPLSSRHTEVVIRVWPAAAEYFAIVGGRTGQMPFLRGSRPYDPGATIPGEASSDQPAASIWRKEGSFILDRLMTRLCGISNTIEWTVGGGEVSIVGYGHDCYAADPSPYRTHWHGDCTGRKPYRGTNWDGRNGVIREVTSHHRNRDEGDPRLATEVSQFIQLTLMGSGGFEEIYEIDFLGEGTPDGVYYGTSVGTWQETR